MLSSSSQGNKWLLTGWADNKKELSTYDIGEGYDSSDSTNAKTTHTCLGEGDVLNSKIRISNDPTKSQQKNSAEISPERIVGDVRSIEGLFRKDDGGLVNIRYADKNRVQEWLNVNRVQFPLRSSNLNSIGIVEQYTDKSQTKNSSERTVGDVRSESYREDVSVLVSKGEDITPEFTGTDIHSIYILCTFRKK